jgi:hypothetical protein
MNQKFSGSIEEREETILDFIRNQIENLKSKQRKAGDADERRSITDRIDAFEFILDSINRGDHLR